MSGCLANSQGERNMKVNGFRKCNESGRVQMFPKPGTIHVCLGCILDMMQTHIYFLIRRKEENSISFNSKSLTSGNCINAISLHYHYQILLLINTVSP